ncbi:MAG: 2-oxoacid:acceptor oxidoreductase family protein [Firmicutes bacterium]|nr:2-oxoacid:acceptor oxidoreductase family protein [Bacillota bacterium]
MHKAVQTPDRLGIRLTGRGGQGIILSGVIIAQAAMYDGRFVVHTQSYGPEARLGASKSEVMISRWEIAFPEVVLADILLCLSLDAYLKYGSQVASNSLSVIDDLIGITAPAPGQVILPLRRTARDLGNELSANIVGLGALVAITELVEVHHVQQAIKERVKPEFSEVNLKAFTRGLELGEQWHASA